MLITLTSPLPVPVAISDMSVLICNRFHTRKANSGKITFLRGLPLFDARVRGESFLSRGTKFCHDKLESSGQPTLKIS